ncbi:MAG: hypothetical protein DMG15_00805 [Acidobacteria bacterium]|nr:MAG: hypothetical protein DMG15_00805 [Acidobacteriota bacterium]
MIRRMKVILTGLGLSLVLVSASGYAQDRAQQPPSYTPTPSEKLPDWSGAWQMMGGTVFDAATQTGKGGAIDLGVREHPPYNAEWEALYQRNLEKRDQNRFPDVFTNCGVPASYPRVFNLPDPYEFVIRPEQVWILAENGPNVMRIYTIPGIPSVIGKATPWSSRRSG